MVVLEVGANDGLRGVDPDSTYANLVKLVAAVRAGQPGVSLALVQMEAPTNLGRSYTTRFHTAYERAARETGIPLWPFLLDGVAGDATLNQADGIHPNVVGSQRVVRRPRHPEAWSFGAPVGLSLPERGRTRYVSRLDYPGSG